MDSALFPDVPKQVKGNELNVEFSIDARSSESAMQLFRLASQRLLDVNHWHLLTSPTISVFQLTDDQGEPVSGAATVGHYFRIDIPGPDSNAGDGFDWVRVEKIFHGNSSETTESISIQVRPAPNPIHPKFETAHFFGNDATSTFRVLREGLTVTAGVYGRNELPNVDSQKISDTMRNVTIATGAILGASRIQWEALVKGLLRNPDNK